MTVSLIKAPPPAAKSQLWAGNILVFLPLTMALRATVLGTGAGAKKKPDFCSKLQLSLGHLGDNPRFSCSSANKLWFVVMSECGLRILSHIVTLVHAF